MKSLSPALLLVWLFLSACSALSPPPDSPPQAQGSEVTACNRYYRDFNAMIEQHRVNDAQTQAIAGHPYLHVNRFLAGLKSRLNDENSRRLWLELAAQLALQTHSLEFNNLPASAKTELAGIAPEHSSSEQPGAVLQYCSQMLLQQAWSSPAIQERILEHAEVSDDYRTWQRIVGLYPLVSYPVAIGINRWHEESTAALQTPVAEVPVHGKLIRYQATARTSYGSTGEVQTALRAASQNALQIPLPDADTLQRLFATYAPVFEVDSVLADDQIGGPEWSELSDFPIVNIENPAVYTLASHTIFHGEILLQLNYVVWFARRTCESSWDFLCGHMDGLNWRVTLSRNGEVLLYDVIHNCGCYHTFFPGARLRPLPPPITVESRPSLDERAFTPIQAPQVAPPQHLVLRIVHRTHHVGSLYPEGSEPQPAIALAFQNYHSLRSLPRKSADGYQSLFQPDGLIAGTERKERWFLWPLGVPSAGAMRQWGNHATAFIGRRHFDDPFLLEEAFTPK